MKKKTIMIVDDEPAMLIILKELFELENFNVVQASSGNDAIVAYKQNQVDCILSDIKMPDGSGLEMVKKLRESVKSETPVFLMSGHSEYCVDSLLKNGVQEVFKKPFDIDSAIKRMRRHI